MAWSNSLNMKYINEFNYTNNLNSLYKSNSFTDTKALKQYLRQNNDKNKSNPYFEQIISIVDNFFELRAKAEEINKQTDYFKVFSKERELPISWNTINSVLNPKTEDSLNEPPTRLINIIAKEKFSTIQTLSNEMRKLLQRKREMVPINRVQEIDSACLRWLTKQPGCTTEQKAGNKQQVMSVIRFETYDTLENRVFKDFLRLCISECRRYIEKFDKKFHNSQRLKEVRKLQSLAIITLSKPEMKTIKRLYNYPKPNYVLQNNASYKTIWNLYKKLLQKSKLLETAWSNRQIVVSQYNQLCVINFFNNLSKENKAKKYYFTSPTINLMPTKNGIFINNMSTSLKLIYLEESSTFIHISPLNVNGIVKTSIQYPNNIYEDFYFHFQYIPFLKNDITEISFQKEINFDSRYYFTYKESPLIEITTNNSISKNQLIEIENSDDAYEKIETGMSQIFDEILTNEGELDD